MSMWKTLALLVGSVGFVLSVHADVYHYVDDSGRKVFVDRKSAIPVQYRNTHEVRAGSRQRHALPDPSIGSEAVASNESLVNQRARLQAFISKMETPVSISNNRVLVPVEVRYGIQRLQLQLVLDTGASNTVIHRDALAGIRAFTRPSGQAQIADGSLVDTHAITFDALTVGPYTAETVSTGIIEHQGTSTHDGLLGMDFLKSLQYEVDFQRNMIIWQRDDYRVALENLAKLDAYEAQKGEVAVVDEAQSVDLAE